MHFLITGAAGSGTSTLGKALSEELNATFIEADDFHWYPTVPPFTRKRPVEERRTLLKARLDRQYRSVVSGSVMGWGRDIEDAFDAVVFLYVETEVRLCRLRAREMARFGVIDPDFMEWAAQYDHGTAPPSSTVRSVNY